MPLARIERVVDLPSAAAAKEVEAYWRQVEADTATRRGIVTTLVHQLRNEADTMITSPQSLHAEFGSSHRQGRRARQQDALLVTPAIIAVADGTGERDDQAAAVLRAFAAAGLDGALAEVAPEVGEALPDPPASGTTLTAVTGPAQRVCACQCAPRSLPGRLAAGSVSR